MAILLLTSSLNRYAAFSALLSSFGAAWGAFLAFSFAENFLLDLEDDGVGVNLVRLSCCTENLPPSFCDLAESRITASTMNLPTALSPA